MALPKLSVPQYTVELPSTGKQLTMRPFLVKEEKVLMIALESNDMGQITQAVRDIIISCYGLKDLDDLTVFDIEYLFLQLRAKSVGETSVLSGSCLSEECEAYTDVTIDITQSEVKQEKEVSNVIELTPEISLELKYPSYVSFLKNYKEGMSESKFGLLMIEECVLSVNTPDERITEWTKQEMTAFIDSMTTKQFEKVGEYLSSSPTLQQEIEWSCSSCGHENKKKLEGLSDFF